MPVLPRLPALKHPAVVCAALAAIVFGVIATTRHAGLLEALELGAYDALLRLVPARPADSRVVLVTVSERDIRALGRWPMSDGQLATALERLVSAGAVAVGVDLYRDVPVPPGTDSLEGLLARVPQVVAVMKFGESDLDAIQAPPGLRGTDRVGFNDVLVDPGGVVRRGLLFLDDGKTAHQSFALALVRHYLAAAKIDLVPDPVNMDHLRLGPTTIPPLAANEGGYVGADARGYQFLVDYRGAQQTLPTLSVTEVMNGQMASDAVRGRLAILGVDAVGVKDLFYTPFSRSRRENQAIPGAALHGLMASQLLRSALDGALPIRGLTEWPTMAWTAIATILGSVVALRIRSPGSLALLATTGSLAIVVVAYGALLAAWWIPLVPPMLGWIVASGTVVAYVSWREREDRQLLMQLFSRHVSREVAQEVWQRREEFLDGGRPRPQRMTVTVLFSDLAGFTSISEHREPQALMAWVNEYLDVMVKEISAHGGVINKYAGDSIMALFGVPVPRTTEAQVARDAVNAVECALAMDRALQKLNRRWHEAGEPAVGMRIGIFTGPVVSGSVGSAERLEYTLLGDTVNTASRLESFDKDLYAPDLVTTATRVIVGAATASHLGDRFHVEPVGEVHLKGKADSIKAYRVVPSPMEGLR